MGNLSESHRASLTEFQQVLPNCFFFFRHLLERPTKVERGSESCCLILKDEMTPALEPR